MESSEPVPAGSSNKAASHLEPHRWQKGQSGNPSGRKATDSLRSLLRSHTVRATQRIVELMESEDERVAMMAAKEVLDRYYGKAVPAEEEDTGDRKQVTINIVRYADDKPAEQLAAPTVSVRTLALP